MCTRCLRQPGYCGLARSSPAAYSHAELKEFVLPYSAVRSAADPDEAIRSFVDSTYEQAAKLMEWDRDALERRLAPSL